MDFREATTADVPGMSRLRAERLGTEDFWHARIMAYMSGQHNPQKALAPRVLYVAMDASSAPFRSMNTGSYGKTLRLRSRTRA